jgi:hypothetical protein
VAGLYRPVFRIAGTMDLKADPEVFQRRKNLSLRLPPSQRILTLEEP